jgi:hypothetical protein
MIALLLLMNREADARAYHELARELFDQAEDVAEIEYDSIAANPLRPFS